MASLIKRGNLSASFEFTHTKAAAAPFTAQDASAQVSLSHTGDTTDLGFAHTPVAFSIAGGATTSVDLFTTLTNYLGSTSVSNTKLRTYAFATTGARRAAMMRTPWALARMPIGRPCSSSTARIAATSSRMRSWLV